MNFSFNECCEKWREAMYLALRIVTGFLFGIHGAQKLFGVLGGTAKEFMTQLWWGGLIEFVAGLAVVTGLYFRPATFLACGTMAVAYFQFHAKWEGLGFLPTHNKGETAVLYCFIFLYMTCRGPGICAVKSFRKGRS